MHFLIWRLHDKFEAQQMQEKADLQFIALHFFENKRKDTYIYQMFPKDPLYNCAL